MVDATLCLIDANSLFYRAFYAIKADLTTSAGQPTNAVFGFVKMVRRILDDVKPEYLAVCFDVGKTTHRTRKFSDYKVHRPPMPDSLLSQVPYIREVVAAYNFASFGVEGFEADDVIASIARRAVQKVSRTVIVSSDKDILQLVEEKIEVYNPYKEDGIVFTPEAVREKFGVEPRRIADLIALAGDASDNIPGAKGIGEKTARELLGQFAGVEELLKGAGRVKRESVRRIVEENAASVTLSKELACLCEDVPLDFELEDLKLRPPDADKLWEVFSRLEFKGMLKALSEERLSSTRPSLDIPRHPLDAPEKQLRRIAAAGIFAFFVEPADPGAKDLRVNIAFDDRQVLETGDPGFLKKLFSLKGATAVTHDAKKALRVLRRRGLGVSVRLFDTMIAAHLAESSRVSQDLEPLLWDYLSLKGTSRLDYLGKEAHFLLRLYGPLSEALQERGMAPLFEDVEMPLSDVLARMEEAGVSIDVKFLKTLSQDCDRKLGQLTAAIYERAGCEFNINSPKQLGDVLFNKLKLPVVKRTKTGMSTDEEVLTRLSKESDLPRHLLEYRQIAKLKTTYIDALPELVDEETGKIHSSFNQTGTETGRLSSSNPNLQNIPIKTELGRTIRRAFIPSGSYDRILSADYSQIELRILAHLSEDATLLKAFEEDRDIHRTTAALVLGVGEEDVTQEMRESAKRVNFGIIYGMSAYGLAKDLGIDPKTAQNFIDEYFLRYPGVKEYLDGQIDFVKKNGYVATLLGRRRAIPEIRNPNMAIRQFAERQAVNAPIQGSAADLIKAAMVAIDRKLREKKLKSRMILQVHDELVFEVLDREAEPLAALVRSGMEGVLKLRVPLKTTISIGKNWLKTEKLA